MSRNSTGRGWARRFGYLSLVLVVLIGAAAVGLAWTKPRAAKLLVQEPQKALNLAMRYVQPVDGRERVAAKTDGFDVLLLVLDACRPDKFSAYGFEKDTTPALKALAQDPDATLFRRHYVNGNWTKASTASLFTGMYVHEHGVFMPWQPTGDARGSFVLQVLSDEVETMAEMFAERGYYTYGIVHGHHLDPEYGFAQGFAEYYSDTELPNDRSRLWATNALTQSIEGNYFGYVHMIACHQPFPAGARHRGYMEAHGFDYPEAERRSEGVDFTTTEIKDAINDGQIELTEPDARFLNLVYEAQTREMDENIVKPILETLKETGRYDNTLIVVTADHGEALNEHGSYAHAGPYVWEEVVHVPLIVKYPKGQRPAGLGAEVDEVTSSIDLLPALAALLDRPEPEHARGAAILTGDFAGVTLAEGHQCAAEVGDCLATWAFFKDNYKLVSFMGETLLFDLEQDPLEKRSIAEERPQLLAEMEAAAAELRSQSNTSFLARQIETDVDEDVLNTLRSLGYIQ